MFLSPLNFGCYNAFSFASSFCKPTVSCISPAMAWIAFGKAPENPIVTPSTKTQLILPSSPSKFLQSVTVKATA